MRFELEKRAERSQTMAWASPVIAVVATMITGALIFALLGKPPTPEIFEFPTDQSWALETRAFVDDIRLGREPDPGLAAGISTLEVVERVYAATRRG